MTFSLNKPSKLVVFLFFGLSLKTFAGPGDGLAIGSCVFSPYLALNLTADSNVYKDPENEVSDTFFEPELGLRFSSSAQTNLLSLRGNVFYADRSYSQEKTEDFNSYGDSLDFRYGDGRRSMLQLVQSYRNVDDLDRHAADLDSSALSMQLVEDNNTLDTPRDINQFGALASRRMTDKLELGLSYRYSGVNYDDNPPPPDESQELVVPPGLNLDEHVVQFDGALGLTDKTDAILKLKQGLQYQEGTDGSADYTTARIGLKTQGSDKLVYNVEAGVQRFARPPDIDDEGHVSFNFSGSVDWFVTEKLTFRCGAYNGTQFSAFYLGNALDYVSGWAGMGYRWNPNTTFSVRAVYREDDYIDPVMFENQSRDRYDKRVEGHARIDYLMPISVLRLYVEATYDEVDSNLEHLDYTDERLMVGAILRY